MPITEHSQYVLAWVIRPVLVVVLTAAHMVPPNPDSVHICTQEHEVPNLETYKGC
jgi:hypothetical protein